MPFCTHCGSNIGSSDRFCAHCGSGQTAGASPAAEAPPPASSPAPAPASPKTGGELRPHIAALLCYIPIYGWLASIFFITSDSYRRNRFVHFHALQALFLAVAYFLVRTMFGFSPNIFFEPWGFHSHFGLLAFIRLAVIIIQVVGMVKVGKGEDYRLPVLGDLAERSMA